jgi:hypothetical protein
MASLKNMAGISVCTAKSGKARLLMCICPFLEDAKGSEHILLFDDEEPILRMEQMMLDRI